MKQRFLLLIAGCVTSSLLGCEGYQGVAGIVVDQHTKLPLAGVVCETIDTHSSASPEKARATAEPYQTDATGAFQLHGEFGGCMPECPDIVVRFSKKGYAILQVRNPTDRIFYLVPQRERAIKLSGGNAAGKGR